MIRGNAEQVTRDDMFNVYISGDKKKLPFNVFNTIDCIKHNYQNVYIIGQKSALYFDSIYILSPENYILLDIGYSPTEKLEIKNIDSKLVYFYLPAFNYTYSVSLFSNSTVFKVEYYFAKEFFTVPENIFIEHQGKQLSDDQYIFEIENSKDKPFTISFKKGYQLYYCFFDHFHYVCLRDDSTLRELKDILSSKHNVYFGVVYGEKIKEYFKTSDPKEIEKSTTPISKLSKYIKIFDFCFDPKQEITPIPPFEVLIETDQNPIPQPFNIDSIDSSSTIYLITCILETEFQIDRSLFIPYDPKGNKLELASKIPINSKFKLRIEKPFNVKIGTENKQFSFLTTISDIKRIYNFKENNFGIIINKQFACNQDGKFYLSHFLKNSDDPDEATKIYFKRPISTCHIRSFKNLKTNKTKSFIVPDFFTLEKTVNFYLRKNIKSLLFLKENRNPKTFNFEYEFQIRATRNVNIVFIDENNKPADSVIEIRGENPKIIDLLFAVYQEKNGLFIRRFLYEKYSFFEAFIKINENPKKLHFMQPLSELFDDEDNKITVKGYPYQNGKDGNDKTFTVRNNINGSSLEFKYENISSKEIIYKVKQQNNLKGENFNLYMEYNKLNPDNHPLICRYDENYFIFNKNKETKKFIISNGSPLKVPMTVSQKHFHEISDMIIGMFNIIDTNNLKFHYLAYGKEYVLPRNFDAGSLPDNCEISVNYIYTKSNYATFSYDGKTTKIQLSNIETPIDQLKREIQEKLNKYNMTLKSMSFSFYKAPLDEKKKFTEYKITENSKINIIKSKDSFSITVKTPEKVSHIYEVTTSDTSIDIKELIKSQFCYDQEIQLLDERGRKLTEDQQLTPDMKLLLNCQKAEIQSEGTLRTKKHLINEILSIEEANQYLKTKLNNENISIFTFNENDNCFEIVDPNKKLFEIETKLFVHQLFKIKYLYFGEHSINIHSDFNETSECNTVEWLKKNIISSKIIVPPEDFQLSTKKRKIDENKMIYEVFNEDNPVQVKFIFENKTKESDENIKSQKRYKPTAILLTSDDSKIQVKNENHLKDDDDKSEKSKPRKIKDDGENFSLSQKSSAGFISLSMFDDFENKQRIGRGATSEVYKIKISKYPSKDFALKIIDIDIIKKENFEEEDDDDDDLCPFDIEKLKRFMNEFEVLNQIDHPNIIKAYGFYPGDRKNPPAILLEFCPYNLKKIIKKLNYQQQIKIINEISEGMKKIHEVNIIHRDLKPENILIDSENHVKISDFGICTLINLDSETMSRTQFAGTMKFMAPEIINESKHYDEKVDVYSFGVVVYYILTNGEYPSIKLVDVAKGEQAEIPSEISDFWKELIQKCWSFDPSERPSFQEITEILRKMKIEDEDDEEEKITCNIQIGREAVRKITLKKNATINDAKIKIAKENDDIDPNCVSILFAGKNLMKTTVIEKLKLTKDDVLQVYIQNIEEVFLQTAKGLQVYGDDEENYSEYD